MLSCPRCVRSVPPDAAQCPTCGYDIAAAARSAPYAAPGQVAGMQPRAGQPHPGWVAASAPTGQMRQAAPYEDPTLVPGFADGQSQFTGPPEEPRRYWWGLGVAVVIALALLALITVLAVNRGGHRRAADATPATTAALTPTGGTSPSGAVSSSAATSASASASSPSTSAADSQRGRAQASTIGRYLTDSGQARQGIGAAISAISGCTNIGSAVATLDNAADVRSRIVTELATANVSALRNGGAAVADLSRAMRASADADRHYAAWGRAVSSCHGQAPQNADFAAAQQSDSVATAAKQRFADEWNPIAATFGLAKQSADTI